MIKSSRLLKSSLSSVYPQTQAVVNILQGILDSTLSLLLRSHEAHWNVKGMSFGPLHELFGSFYDFLDSSSDTIAERIVQLDGTVSSNPTGNPISGDDVSLLQSLQSQTQMLAEVIKQAITAVSLSDEVTGDILIEFGRELEKFLWKIEATLR